MKDVPPDARAHYRQQAREGRQAARIARTAQTKHAKRKAAQARNGARLRKRMEDRARRFIRDCGRCTLEYLISADFAPDAVAKHGRAAIRAAEKKGQGT